MSYTKTAKRIMRESYQGGYTFARDGMIYITDAEEWIIIPADGLADGVYGTAPFIEGMKIPHKDLALPDMPVIPNELRMHPREMMRDMIPNDDMPAIEWVKPHMSDDPARRYLRGVCYKGKEYAATDGKTLAIAPATYECMRPDGVIVPACLFEGKGAKAIYIGDKWAVTDYPGYLHAAPLIDGTYPDYRRVMPDIKASNTFTIQNIQAIKKHYAMLKRAGLKKHYKIETLKAVNGMLVSDDGTQWVMGGQVLQSYDARNLAAFGDGAKVTEDTEYLNSAAFVTSKDDPAFIGAVIPLRD